MAKTGRSSGTQLLAGQDNKLTLKGDGAACVEHIALSSAEGTKNAKDVDVKYEPAKGDGGSLQKDTLALDVSLKTVEPGGYSLGIKQFGDENQERVPLTAYNANIKLDAVTIHSGDRTAVLTGKGLSSVGSVEIAGETFTPSNGSDDATMQLEAKTVVTPKDGDEAKAKLKDGRVLTVKVAAQAARPALSLVSMTASPAEESGTMPVVLGGKDKISLYGKLTFVITTHEVFPRTQKVEIATADGSVKTLLSLADNNLVLQDEHTAVATLDPLKHSGNRPSDRWRSGRSQQTDQWAIGRGWECWCGHLRSARSTAPPQIRPVRWLGIIYFWCSHLGQTRILRSQRMCRPGSLKLSLPRQCRLMERHCI